MGVTITDTNSRSRPLQTTLSLPLPSLPSLPGSGSFQEMRLGDTPSFGQWLSQRRKALDLTQEELAGRMACSGSMIRKLEAGQRVASQEMAELLADLLGVASDERAAFVQFAKGRMSADAAKRKLWKT